MKLGNLRGRAVLINEHGAADVNALADGRFSSDVDRIYRDWTAFRSWADAITANGNHASKYAPFALEDLEAPVVTPRQIFAVGLNYPEHAAETNLQGGRDLVIFTKFASSLTGPCAEVALPGEAVDWEVEVTAVIGVGAYQIDEASAWDHIAGLAVSQDLSDRKLQMQGVAPQFSLAKSYPGFSPVGPWLVTPDELRDRESIAFGCALNGEIVQQGTTGELIFTIPQIVSELSQVLPLLPGDLIFTGTPSGVGMARTPPLYLKPGDELVSWADQLGELRTRLV